MIWFLIRFFLNGKLIARSRQFITIDCCRRCFNNIRIKYERIDCATFLFSRAIRVYTVVISSLKSVHISFCRDPKPQKCTRKWTFFSSVFTMFSPHFSTMNQLMNKYKVSIDCSPLIESYYNFFFCSNILILRNGTKWFIFDPILTEWREHNLIQENYHFSIDAKYICKLKFQFNCLWHCRSLDLCTSQTMRKCTNRLAMSNMNFYQLKRQLDSLRSSFSSKYISS